MTELYAWLTTQLAEKHVEPNSEASKAMMHLLTHWEGLTLFLRQPRAPLDNNIAERALKKATLHRKNAYFYKTKNGAHVGDLYMNLIHTCELCGANSFDYLTELQHHATELALNPSQWMPMELPGDAHHRQLASGRWIRGRARTGPIIRDSPAIQLSPARGTRVSAASSYHGVRPAAAVRVLCRRAENSPSTRPKEASADKDALVCVERPSPGDQSRHIVPNDK
jgi:hypothetical protein